MSEDISSKGNKRKAGMKTASEANEDIEAPKQIAANFEEAVERLSAINTDLQSGKLPLEEALKKYEEAIQLRQYATEMLAGAKVRIAIAGEKKTVANFRMQLNTALSEFEEDMVEAFREKREPSQEKLELLWAQIKGLMSGG